MANDDPEINAFLGIDKPSLWSRAVGAAQWPLEKIAQVGRIANQGNQELAGNIAETSGKLSAGETPIPLPQSWGGSIQPSAIPGVLGAGALATASQFLMPQTKVQAAMLPLQAYGAMKGASAADAVPLVAATDTAVPEEAQSAIANAASKVPGIDKNSFIVQAMKAYPKISPGDSVRVLSDPSVLWGNQTLPEAEAAYADAVKGLPGKVESIGARLGKTVLTSGDYDDSINRVGRMLAGTEVDPATGQPIPITPRDALEGLQSINARFKFKGETQSMTPDQVRAVGQLKDQIYNYLNQAGYPDIQQAASDLRDANIRENFGSWLPQNKFGSSDALRSVLAIFNAAKGVGQIATGNVVGGATDLAASAAVSPKIVGTGIKGYMAMKNAGVGIGSPVDASSLIYGPSVATNLFQKKQNQDQDILDFLNQ